MGAIPPVNADCTCASAAVSPVAFAVATPALTPAS
ncbi:Uncharacterised protein [Mycobacteroides abscessus subsp. abscessus]|nr:Uncharacterised protein [Mycobacteroides abscessus subsp. abscessus]